MPTRQYDANLAGLFLKRIKEDADSTKRKLHEMAIFAMHATKLHIPELSFQQPRIVQSGLAQTVAPT